MDDMLMTHVEAVDLNLLPPLAALLEERQVTRAAERSGLSQPAMSRALARLRRRLDDQLLVCDGSVYVPTPRDNIDGEQPLIASRLSELGAARRASLSLPLSVGAPAVLPDTNLVATLNKRLVDKYSDDPAIAVVAAPVELEPFDYFMVWHPRLDHDPAQQWLRATIRSVAVATVGGSARHALIDPTTDRRQRPESSQE